MGNFHEAEYLWMPMESSPNVLRNPPKCGPSTLASLDRQVLNLNQFQISRIAKLAELEIRHRISTQIEGLKNIPTTSYFGLNLELAVHNQNWLCTQPKLVMYITKIGYVRPTPIDCISEF